MTLTYDEAVRIGRGYVGAYNDRDVEAMIALQHKEVVAYPARLFGLRSNIGHAGVRAWWEAMTTDGRWYHVEIGEIRQLGADRVVVFGELRDLGEPVSPWVVVFRVRDGLIIESRSYLSDEGLLDELGLLE